MTRTPHSGRAQQTQEEGRGAPGGRGVHGRRGRAAHVELLPLWRENFGQSVCIKRPRSSQRLQFFQHDIRCLSFRQSTAQMLSAAHLFIFSVLI